jgi:tetratricopeptide (TPR) repeat protein
LSSEEQERIAEPRRSAQNTRADHIQEVVLSTAKRTLTFIAVGLLCGLAWPHAGDACAQSTERLGKMNFPTTCAAAAQPHVERGVALLHSFWFGEAIKAFQSATVADPSCGIAHWDTAVAHLGNPLAGPPTPRGMAWLARSESRNAEALALMRQAADREDATEKHPVTPGAVQRAREMLGDVLLELGPPAKTLVEFEASQRKEPNRLHGFASAAAAAEVAGDRAKAKTYYEQLIALTKGADTARPRSRAHAPPSARSDRRDHAMNRREVLQLGAMASTTFAMGGVSRLGLRATGAAVGSLRRGSARPHHRRVRDVRM